MTLDDFLSVTGKRIPTVAEMIELCEHLDIGFNVTEGKPCLRHNGGNESEAAVLARLFRREPFRSMVIEAKGLVPAPPEEPEQAESADAPPVPTGEVYMADKGGRKCNQKDCYMWTWVGAAKWYYVSQFPVQM